MQIMLKKTYYCISRNITVLYELAQQTKGWSTSPDRLEGKSTIIWRRQGDNGAGVAAHTSWGGRGEGVADILSPVLVPGLPPVSVFPPPDRRQSQWPPTKEPCYPLSRTPSPSLRTSSLEVFPRPSPRPPWRPSSVSSCCCKYNTSASRSPSKTATRVSTAVATMHSLDHKTVDLI